MSTLKYLREEYRKLYKYVNPEKYMIPRHPTSGLSYGLKKAWYVRQIDGLRGEAYSLKDYRRKKRNWKKLDRHSCPICGFVHIVKKGGGADG